MKRMPPKLLALSPGHLGPRTAAAFVHSARSAIGEGLRGIVLREPGLADGETLGLARRLAELLSSVDGWLAIHDRVHLVSAAGAQAAHVGFRSLPPAAARSVLGEDRTLGFSSHAGDGPEAWAGSDYVFHGPVNDTPSKAGIAAPIGLPGLRTFTAGEGAPPVWALGGITPGDCAPALANGARGVAVLGGIFGQDRSPVAATRAYLTALEEAS